MVLVYKEYQTDISTLTPSDNKEWRIVIWDKFVLVPATK